MGEKVDLNCLIPSASPGLVQFFTRRRDDKGVIPRRSTKVDDLQAMADATVKKLKNLRESAPQKCSFNINILPAQPITTGQLCSIEIFSNDRAAYIYFLWVSTKIFSSSIFMQE